MSYDSYSCPTAHFSNAINIATCSSTTYFVMDHIAKMFIMKNTVWASGQCFQRTVLDQKEGTCHTLTPGLSPQERWLQYTKEWSQEPFTLQCAG